MFYAPKFENATDRVNNIYLHFKGCFPNISDDILYERIKRGFYNGESDLLLGWPFYLQDVNIWKRVFYAPNKVLTLFNSWDEYLKYDGDYCKHPCHNLTMNNHK